MSIKSSTPPEGFGYIYKITFPSKRCYIGQTMRSIGKRISHHIGNTKCSALSRAISKYGKESMIIEILHCCPISELDDNERMEISNHNSVSPNGYNLEHGGVSFPRFISDETRAKHSAYTGRHPSLETRIKLSLSHIGQRRKHTEETKRKIGIAHKGRKWTEEQKARARGRKISEETREKLRVSHLGQRHSEESIRRGMEKVIPLLMSKERKEKLRLVNTGRKHTEESKTKMRISIKAYWDKKRVSQA